MLSLATVCLLAITGYVFGVCNEGCNEPTLFYEALNCTPVFASPDDCCPTEYDCLNIEEKGKANEERCYFHGKTYNCGELIDREDIYGNCQVGCHCRKLHNENMGFVCAVLDCPEWLGYRAKPSCYLKYELGKCCSVGEVCPPYNATCEVEGKTYHAGQKFTPPDLKCTKCVCQEGFEGKFEEPFCTKNFCIDEARRQNEVYSFCAPSYHDLNDCCPVYWICPEEGDEIIAETNVNNPNLNCKFGNQTLNIGDKFERTKEEGKVSCECRIPPYLTCVQNYEYPIYKPPQF